MPTIGPSLFKCYTNIVLTGIVTMTHRAITHHIVPLDMKGCICHFAKWHIHPFISKGTICSKIIYIHDFVKVDKH